MIPHHCNMRYLRMSDMTMHKVYDLRYQDMIEYEMSGNADLLRELGIRKEV